MILGIDASNLRSGGGLRHISEFFRFSDVEKHGFEKAYLWIGPATLEKLPNLPSWVEVISVKAFDVSVLARYIWRKLKMKPFVERKCDVLFSPGGLALFCDKPEVTMSRNMQPFDSVEKKKLGWTKARIRLELLRILQGKSFRHAEEVIFLNSFAKEVLCKKLKLDKGVVISHGCGSEFECPPKDQMPLVGNEQIRVCYVSTLNTYKHQLELVEAISILQKKYPNIKLTLVGGGYEPYASVVEEKIEKVNGSSNLVEYIGKVSQNSLPEIYSSSDIFAFASSCENLPNILLEAMSSALPIACSNVEPMPSVLKDAGVYFDPRSVKEIAESIELLITDADFKNDCFQKSV